MKKIILLLLIYVAYPNNALAYQSTMDTGEIVPSGKYRVLGDLQYLSDPNGLNIEGGFDAGVNESSNIRVIAGAGSVNFHTGLFYKWIPFPDTKSQPAIGVMAGGSWARYGGESYPGVRIHPLVSKKFDTDIGLLTPYASLPFGVVSGPKKNTFPFQLTVGSEWKPKEVEDFTLLLELGLNINEAANYVTAGILYYIPE